MSVVVFLRGLNVGGHRTFRPTLLARGLEHLDVVNVGAAGTLVVRRPITHARLRAEIARRLPFAALIVICPGRDLLRMVEEDRFAGQPVRSDVVRFVSVLSKRPRTPPATPIRFPASGEWLLRVLGSDSRFVFGLYRRQMKAIGHLGALDELFGAPVTTRNWNTMAAVAGVLRSHPQPRSRKSG